MLSQRKIGFTLSYVSITISSLIGILFTPYLINSLGQDEYGLYQLLYATIGYVALLDFGLGGTLTRYILKYKSLNEIENMQNAINIGMKLYCIFALFAFIICSSMSFFLKDIFKSTITIDNYHYGQTIFLVMGLSTSLSLISHALTGIETAHEQYLITKGVFLLRQLLRVVILLALLKIFKSALLIAVVDLCVTILVVTFDFLFCKIKLRINIFHGKWDSNIFRSMLCFSSFVFLQTITTQINNGLDRIVLGRYGTLKIVALYGVVMTLHSLFNSIGNVVSGITLPRITSAVFSNYSRKELTSCCAQYSRYQLIISSLFLGGFTLFGKEFLTIWVPEYDAKATFIISMLVIFPQVIDAIEGTLFNVMKAKNLQATRSLILITIALFNIIFTSVIVNYNSLYGPAIVTFISYVLGNTILSNIYYHNKIGIDIFLFTKETFSKIIMVWVASMFIGLLIKQIILPGWSGLIIKCTFYTLFFSIMMYLFGLNKSEKSMINNLIGKIKTYYR